MMFAAHQGQFDLILNVFDLKRMAGGRTPVQDGNHLFGQAVDTVMNAVRSRCGFALGGKKRLRQGCLDFGRIKCCDRSGAPDHLIACCGKM